MVVLNRPADPVKLADSLHRMQNAVNGLLRQTLEGKVTLEFRGETVAGTEMNYFAAPLFSPTWAIGDGTLYVGLYPQVVAAALARPAGSRSILANAAFGRVRQEAGAPSKVSAIVFNDLTRTVPQGYQTVLLMSRLYLGLGDIFGAQSPPLVLPTLTQLKPELEPSGGFAWADSVGLHAKFVTPFPGADALGTGSMAGVGVGEIMAMMTSIGLPSLNQARGTANKVKSANNLRQIGLGIMLYANDNRGKFPPDFGTLLKNEDLTVSVFFSPATNTVPPAGMTPDAAAAWVNANSDYVYLGSGLTNSTATADTVLAYEKETVNGGEGINLLFGDGHVEFNTLPQAHAEIDASKKSRGL
jgi:prepilin-type processing-associated H-X9-DG protein